MIKFLSKKLIKSLSIIALSGLTVSMDAQTLNWNPAGPIYTAGRTRNMIVDKTDASGNTLYVGSTTSGVFKSNDGGQNWFPLNDQGVTRNISYMAQAQDGTIYAGTGEGFLRTSQALKAQPGTGLYKLTGNILTLLPGSVSTGTLINRIACDPTNAAKIAITTNLGVFYSTDSGASFTAANTGTATGMGQDVKFDGNGNLYFSIGAVAGSSPIGSTVWKSNGPLTGTSVFSDITPVTSLLPNANYGRIELAVAPNNPNVVYASCANKYITKSTATLLGLFVTYDGGTNWGNILIGSSQLDPLSNGGTIASGDYAHVIVVNPSNSNQLFFGGYKFYVFTRTGGSDSSPIGTWQTAGSPFAFNSQFYLRENIHDIKIVGSNPAKLYFITDGGIYRSTDIATASQFPPSFQPFYKGLITGQFNSVSIDRFPGASSTPTAAIGTTLTPYQTYIGGTAGNGLTYFSGNFPLVTKELTYQGGDIFNAEYSKILPKAAYFSSGSGSIFRSADVTTGTDNLTDYVQNTATQNILSLNVASYNQSGVPFKLWEYTGKGPCPDSLVFYNDTSIARNTIPSLTTTTQFTFNIGRPQPTALIDSIVIRTSTVVIPATPSKVSIPTYSTVNTKTISIKLNQSYTQASSTATMSAPIQALAGYTGSASSFSVILNPITNLDQIYIALAAPLFTSQPSSVPTVPNVADYLRVVATVYYKYPANSVIKLIDNSISTISSSLTINTPTSGTMSWNTNVNVNGNLVKNPVLKLGQKTSARLAIPFYSAPLYSIRVSNSPLDLNAPLSFITISQDKCLTTDATGAPTSNTINIVGKPTVLEWAKSGTYLYYATEAGSTSNLYRVSRITSLIDSTSKGYGGKLNTNVFTFSNTPAPPTYTATAFATPNPRSPYRTTLLGTFSKKITSISIPSNDSLGMVITFDDPTPTGTVVMVSTGDIRKSNFTNIAFTNVTSPVITGKKTYCSLQEKSDYKKTFIGTDDGLYYTDNITAGTPIWQYANKMTNDSTKWLPKVQIFDLEQQTLDPWNCYNSGQIFVATNGRGIWTNSAFYTPYVVAVNEIPRSTFENNVNLFPNPSNGNVQVTFNGISGESAVITVFDVNGRIVKTENLGKLNAGDVNYTFDTSNLNSGIYIVNIAGDSGIKRVAKLIVTK